MNDANCLQSALREVLAGRLTPADALGVSASAVRGLYAMGVALHERGDFERAASVFRRCVLFDPRSSSYWIALASARLGSSAYDEAGEYYQLAAILTDDPAPLAYAAAAFSRAGQLDRARALAADAAARTRSESDLRPWLDIVESCNPVEGRPS